MKRVMIVAGEPSGDLHGSMLVSALKRLDPEIQVFGIGGERMRKEGVEIIYDASELAVVGIVEVLIHLKIILLTFQRLRRLIEEEPPELLILIDYPDFNLRLARIAKRKGVPVLYYISPQVWAWRKRRIKTIARLVNKMVVVFPFEVSLYQKEGVDVEFVGHPLLDVVKLYLTCEESLIRFGLDPGKITIGLLPGSRKGEIKRILPCMLDAAKLLMKEIDNLQFVIPLAAGLSEESVREIIEKKKISVQVVKGYTYDVINTCLCVMVASGTATLETAILGKPMVIVYKVSYLTYLIGKLMIDLRNIGLVNIVAGKEICPELIQREAHPRRIAEEIKRLVQRPDVYQGMKDELKEIKEKLGSPGAGERVARIVYSMLSN